MLSRWAKMPQDGTEMVQLKPYVQSLPQDGAKIGPHAGPMWVNMAQRWPTLSEVDNDGLKIAPDDFKRDLNGFKMNARWREMS